VADDEAISITKDNRKGETAMAKVFVREIKENSLVESIFLVKEKSMGLTRDGNSYLSLRLLDKTGEIKGRVWDNAEVSAKLFEKDDFVKIKSRAVNYQGAIQLNITEINRYSENEVMIKDFLPESKRDTGEIFDELKEVVEQIKDPYLKRLLDLFFTDGDLIEKFKKAPAAKGLHHCYLGGLIEHTLSVVRLIQDVTKRYRGINADLLIAGGILHDIGKVHELSYSRSFDYTDKGRLLGHIMLGIEMVEEKIRQIQGFPGELSMLLKHLIISHHGKYEYESPKRPMTIEALILYYLDDLDAKVENMQSFIEKDRGENKRWTAFHRMFDRFIFKEGRERVEEEEEQDSYRVKKVGDD
jgi:3'-5' exoribonuclease